MSKSKIDFIADLLSHKKLETSMKEKFLTLAVNELKKIDSRDEHLWEELGKLKEEFQKEFKSKKKPEKKKATPSVIVHDPKRTSKSLKLFKTGSKLKWITHIYPNSEVSQFDYELITKNAIAEFSDISRYLPTKVAAFISVFLQQPSSLKNKIFYLGDYYDTWWSEKIVNWCKNNPGIHPDTDDYLSKNIITPFKKGVEIRDGEDLINAIKYKLEKTFTIEIFSQLEIDFSGVASSTRFFTGVDQLMTGIASLFGPICKRKLISNKVKIATSIGELHEQYVTIVEITHIGSYCDKECSAEVLLNGDLVTAKDEFMSLCEWQIESKFANRAYSIFLLNSASKTFVLPIEDRELDGFTHKLIFY